MNRSAVIPLFTFLAVSAFEVAAFAQDEAPSSEALETAAEHYQVGAEHYTVGEYSKAIVAFLKAYNAVPNAMFLYNISLSYGKLSNVEDALAAAYKARDGEGLDDETARRNHARIAAYERWTRAARIAERAGQDDPDGTAPSATVARSGEPPQEVARRSRFGPLGYSGTAVAVVGGGLLVGAGVVAGAVKDDIAEYEDAAQAGDRERFDELDSSIAARQTTGKILLFSGVGLASAGILMILIDLASPGEPRPVVGFGATSGGPFATFQTEF